jgi:hypothetical protein
MAKKEVAVQQTGEVSMFSNEAPDWAKSGNRGSENVGTKDLMIPRLEIVQAQSPIKDVHEDARDGMLFNTVTQELLGDTVFVVPVFYRMEYLLWKDQDAGGGFFGAYDTEAAAQRRLEEEVANGESRDELEIVDTPVHYCLRVKPDMTTEQIVISMSKSKAKVSRKWNSLIQIAGGDRFARAYKLTTFKDQNKQNKTFFNYVVQPAGFPSEAVYREGEKLYNVIKTEGIKADHAAGGPESEGVAPEGGDDI